MYPQFQGFVELISRYLGDAFLNDFPFGPKNAQYMAPKYDSKFIEIVNNHLKNPLLTSLRLSCCTFVNDKNKV